jgi:hypothetical protein
LLVAELVSPLYAAVIVCVPTVSPDVVSAALPFGSRLNDASRVVPSLRLTVPVGMPPAELTTAVNEIGCPAVIEVGSEDADSVVIVGLGVD